MTRTIMHTPFLHLSTAQNLNIGYAEKSNGDTLKWKTDFLEHCKFSSNNETRNLPELLQRTRRFLSSIPKEFCEEYMQKKLYDKLLKKDFSTGIIVYWQEIDERIKFLRWSTGLKTLSLLEDIVTCINSKNYFPAIISTRALLENVAVLHFCFCKINVVYEKVIKTDIIGKIARKEIRGAVVSEELENLLIKYSHGTTLKELIKIQEKWKQTRISEHIRFLSRNRNYRKASRYYSLLCQVAHPSFGSTWVFYYGGKVEDGKELHYFRKKQSLNFFLAIASYPLNISCKILRDEIPKLENIKFM